MKVYYYIKHKKIFIELEKNYEMMDLFDYINGEGMESDKNFFVQILKLKESMLIEQIKSCLEEK